MKLVFAAGLAVGAGAAHAQSRFGYEPWSVANERPLVCGTQEELGFDPHHGCGKACALKRRFEAGLPIGEIPGPGVTDEALGATDLLSNDAEIEILPSTSSLAGTNTMTVRSLVDGLTEFTFRLRSSFTVTGPGGANTVLLNGTTTAALTQVSTTTKRVTLDRVYNAGETFTVTVSYSGVPVSLGFGSIEFTTQGGQPLVFTLSEAYYAYTWWPTKDGDTSQPGDNADKATVKMALIVPSGMVGASNGVLKGVDALSGGRSRYRWESNYPTATYLVFFSMTNYNQWTQTWTYPGVPSMPVQFFIFPASDTAGNRAAWEKCIPMLSVFSDLFGVYPFKDEKYGIYHFGFGGGMEHQTFTGQGGFGESLTAHELGHQWWGDDVTCRTWHDIWLNEGFATYCEAMWEERKPGSTGLPALFSAMNSRRPTSFTGSVWNPDVTSMSRIFSTNYSYRKGGWALHTLRKVASYYGGDQRFFDILAAHRAAHSGSGATTDDFKNVCSAVLGQDMSWFFDGVIYGIGVPVYAYSISPRTINGKNYAALRVRQTQSTSWGVGGVFTLPIDIRVNYSGGNITRPIWNNARTEHYVLPVPAAPTTMVLDEFDWILENGETSEAFVAGPAAVVEAAPAPGASFPFGSGPASVSVWFSEPVNTPTAGGGDFEVTRAGSPVSFTLSRPDANSAVLAFTSPLGPGTYTVRARASIVTTSGAIALDGELKTPGAIDYIAGSGGLPSGDGQPGGDAVWTFTVQPCRVDLNEDGELDFSDIEAFIALYNLGDPRVDFNGDEEIDFSDIEAFLALYTAGC